MCSKLPAYYPNSRASGKTNGHLKSLSVSLRDTLCLHQKQSAFLSASWIRVEDLRRWQRDSTAWFVLFASLKMNNNREVHRGEGSSGGLRIVQLLHDLESNWAVDLAKNLEEYLLNFAEAALLLQGSVQVYSRKVEYLYSLILHALEFISQKRQEDQAENTSVQPGGIDSDSVADEENELFLGLDDVLVEAKNCIDGVVGKDDTLNHFTKPPANLVVLEGDCLDTTGDAGELESYLLTTNDFYRDFILLDPCDAVGIQDFLNGDKFDVGHNIAHRGSSLSLKTRKSIQSPTKRSGGTFDISSLGKSQDVNLNPTSGIDSNFEFNADNICPNPPTCNIPEDNYHKYKMDGGYSEPRDDPDDSDDDDPWKLLNPHEPGNFKVKPFEKVKVFRRQGISSTKCIDITTKFPVAKLHGTISPEFTETLETQLYAFERPREALSLPLYEKLRQSLLLGGHETCNCNLFNSPGYENEDNDYGTNFPDVEMPDYMNAEIPLYYEKHGDDAVHFNTNEVFGKEDPHSHESLEDLCHSHLDTLIASIAETEKQTELAARVSTWKQRIEHNLEEQLNNGNVDLDRGEFDGESVCYTAVNPFHVRHLSHDPRWKKCSFDHQRGESEISNEERVHQR